MGIQVGYINILETAASVTVTSAQTNYPAYRLYDRMFGLFWQSASAATTQIVVDQGPANIQPADTLIIPANHNLAGLNLVWQVSNDDASWTTLFNWTQPDSNLIFKQYAAPVSYRYHALTISAPSAAPQMTELFITLMNAFSPGAQPSDKSTFGWERQSLRVRNKSGIVQLILTGSPARWVDYHLDVLTASDLAILEAMDQAWAGNKPFFFIDAAGGKYFVELYASTATAGTDRGAMSVVYGYNQLVNTAEIVAIEVLQ